MGCIILELSLNFKYKYFTCGLVSDTYKPTAVFDLGHEGAVYTTEIDR